MNAHVVKPPPNHACQEDRVSRNMQDLILNKEMEKVSAAMKLDISLASRIVGLLETGYFSKPRPGPGMSDLFDETKLFPKCESQHGKLSMKNLDFLFRRIGMVPETCDAIMARERLIGCRWLWCWLMDVDMKDKLPDQGCAAASLGKWALARHPAATSRHLAQQEWLSVVLGTVKHI